ncbi:AtpZ/AtpI family protein [Paenibacillus taiwanensis]|uniref:AtpZ/AtpI family protein n=1 Tax=Paenibacillus taiwanensis TaxID=401638 RepID=UPI00048C337A|nr:AtpZ/AtpI family protein [Paenibacillus taiwanensis]
MVKPSKPRGKRTPWSAVGLVSAIGVDISLCTVGGYYLGSWLKDQLGGSDLWVASGVLLGVLTGILSIIILINKVMGEADG